MNEGSSKKLSVVKDVETSKKSEFIVPPGDKGWWDISTFSKEDNPHG